MSTADPIVDDVRRARDELLRQSDYDLKRFLAAVRRREAESGRVGESLPSRPLQPPGDRNKKAS